MVDRGVALVVAVGVLALGVLALVVLAVGCSSETNQADPVVTNAIEGGQTLSVAEKNGTGELRTDLEPLTSRFTAIGTPVAASWMSGTTGDDRVPGPSTYWIDAIITLDAQTAKSLRNDFSAEVVEDVPPVVDGLVADLPDGPWLTSRALGQHTDGGGLGGLAFVARDSDELVIVKVGEGN